MRTASKCSETGAAVPDFACVGLVAQRSYLISLEKLDLCNPSTRFVSRQFKDSRCAIIVGVCRGVTQRASRAQLRFCMLESGCTHERWVNGEVCPGAWPGFAVLRNSKEAGVNTRLLG